MRTPAMLFLLGLAACGPSSSGATAPTTETLPRGAVQLDLELLAATLCPECAPDGDVQHVLMAKLDGVGLEDRGDEVRVSLDFQRWKVGLVCNENGCTHQLQQEPRHACFHVVGTKVTGAGDGECPAVSAPASATVAPLGEVEALVGPGLQGSPVLGGGVLLPSGDSLVDVAVTWKPSAQLGTFADPDFAGVMPLVALGSDAGVQIFPAPDGVPMQPASSGREGAVYWHDRSDAVYALDAEAHRLMARPVRAPLAGQEAHTAQVVESPNRVLSVVQVPSFRQLTGRGPGAVVTTCLLETKPLQAAAAPLVAFAPLWARAPSDHAVTLCFNRALDAAALSQVAVTASDGLQLEAPAAARSSQCVELATSAQDRAVRYQLHVTGARAADGDTLGQSFIVSVPPWEPALDGGTP